MTFGKTAVLTCGLLFAGQVPAGSQAIEHGFFVTRPTLQGIDAIQSVPSIASNGEEFLVLFTDWRSNISPTASHDDWQIWGTRVSRDGVVLDPGGFLVVNARVGVIAVSDGKDYLVAWRDTYRILAVRVSREGEVLDRVPIWVNFDSESGEGLDSTSPFLAVGNKNGYFFVWVAGRNGDEEKVIARRLDRSGSLLDAEALRLGTRRIEKDYLALATSGSDYLITWTERSTNWPWPIRVARVRADGTVLDPEGSEVGLPGGYGAQLFWTGRSFVALYYTGSVLDGTQQLMAGVIDGNRAARSIRIGRWFLDSPRAVIALAPDLLAFRALPNAAGQTAPVLMKLHLGPDTKEVHVLRNYPRSGPRDSLLLPDLGLTAWIEQRAGSSYDIVGRFTYLDENVTESHDQLISATAPTQSAHQLPKTASGHGNQLLVWIDRSTSTLNSALVRQDNKPVVSSPFAISEAGAFNSSAFTVVSGPEDFLVFYGANRLHARRVSPEGISSSPVDIDELNVLALDAAANMNSYLVAFESEGKIYGRVLDRSLVGPRIGIALQNNTARDPAVATDGKGYFVAWSVQPGAGIRGAYVDSSGKISPQDGFAITDRATAGPVISFNGRDYVTAWSRSAAAESDQIEGRHIGAAGEGPVSEVFPIGSAVAGSLLDIDSPGREFPGDHSVLVWEAQGASGRPRISVARLAGPRERRVVHVSSIDAIPLPHASPSIAHVAGGDFLVATESRLSGTQISGHFISIFEPIFIIGQDVYVAWKTVPETKVRVEAAASLSQAQWQPLSPAVFSESPIGYAKDPGQGEAPQRFYRIILGTQSNPE